MRRLVGYKRYDTEEERKLLAALDADGERGVNFFPPIQKKREGSKVHKEHDRAQTPCQRVLASAEVDETVKGQLRQVFSTLPLVAAQRIAPNLRGLCG